VFDEGESNGRGRPLSQGAVTRRDTASTAEVEPPPFDGFAAETRGYLRLLERWHPGVPRMSAKGTLVLTHAVDFGKKYPREKAISPDRIPTVVRKTFAESLIPCPDPDLMRHPPYQICGIIWSVSKCE